MNLQELFEANRILFYSFYGQVFFILGISVALSARHGTNVPLAQSLWLLSAFGFVHAFYEWTYVILPVQRSYLLPQTYRTWEILQRLLEALSFAFLLQFGASVVGLSRPNPWLKYVAVIALAVWLSVFVYVIPPFEKEVKPASDLADLWARYLLCFPGACLSAYGLFLQTRQAQEMGVQQVEAHLKLAAVSFLIYAVVAGLLVPPAPFFPASWLNRRISSTDFGIPSPVIRAAAGMLITYFTIRSLEVFKIEQRRRLEEAGRIRALAQDRERISRELHDGILQHLYGAGLHLESALAAFSQDANATPALIRKAIHFLNRGMQEIRNYVFDLNWNTQTDLESKLKDLIGDLNGNELDIRLEVLGQKMQKLPPDAELHLYRFVQEALTNAKKHAHASTLKVTLACGERALSVKVADDGLGFALDDARQTNGSGHQGLNNMKRRAELLNAKYDIRTGPAIGTTVTLTIPLEST